MKIKNKAFTLVELLLVVGIIALGSVVAYITLPKVASSMKAHSTTQSINTIYAGVENLYGNRNNYNGLTKASLVASKVISQSTADLPEFDAIPIGNDYYIVYPIDSTICAKVISNLSASHKNLIVGVTGSGGGLPSIGFDAKNPASYAEGCAHEGISSIRVQKNGAQSYFTYSISIG